MGKSIVIPGIDASIVNIGKIKFSGNIDLKGDLITYTNNRLLLYPQTADSKEATIQKTSPESYFIDLGSNASEYEGATLHIKWQSVKKASYYIDSSHPIGAYYRGFASSINVTLPVNSTTHNAVTIVEPIDGEDDEGVTPHLIDKYVVIPSGTRYIILNFLSYISLNDTVVEIIS